MVDEKKQLKTTYEGYEIVLDYSGYTWQFSVDLDGEQERADSHSRIKELIDKHIAAKRKALLANAKVKFAEVQVFTESGNAFTITGLHATNHNPLYKPNKGSKWSSGQDQHNYIDTPTVRHLVEKRKALLMEAKRAEELLEAAEVEPKTSRSYSWDKVDYETALLAFHKAVKDARAGAVKLESGKQEEAGGVS